METETTGSTFGEDVIEMAKKPELYVGAAIGAGIMYFLAK